MAKLKLNDLQQSEAVKYVTSSKESWKEQLAQYKSRMLRIYESTTSFRENPKAKWQTSFKVNKAFEAENKVLPRIIANSPKWIVSVKTDEFDEGDINLPVEARIEKMQKANMYADAIRDYLSYIFDKYDLTEVTKLWAKNMVRYGLGWAKVDYKYDIVREPYKKEEEETDEEGNVTKVITKNVKEKVVQEYPIIDVVNWADLYFDPRYIRLEDMPGIVEVKHGVRLSFFTKNPKKYMNVDKLVDICSQSYDPQDDKGYKSRIYGITGIMPGFEGQIDSRNLTVTKFYGWYEKDDEKDGKTEKLYEFWTVNDVLMVYCDEISQLPFEGIKCFEDTETYFATGFVEPILGLQDELNFKKNAASQYINQSLNRNFIWSANSGINPKHLNSAPGNIIPTTKDAQTALENIPELPRRAVPSNYFQEQNDFERQIQSLTFTIDTTTPQGNQALTNTATGIKVKAYESNVVINMVRKNFEDGLVRLAYKFLQATFENLDDNAVIKKMGDEGFREINKEAMRDAVRRYEIKVEAGSSAFDSTEQKRADAIAQWNIAQQAAAAGVPVNLDEQYKRLMETFEGVDTSKLLKAAPPMQQQQQGGTKPLPMPETDTPGNIPL